MCVSHSPFPIKVVVDITPTSSSSVSVALWTVLHIVSVGRQRSNSVDLTCLERFVTVSNIVKPVDLRLVGEQSSADRVDRRVSPSLVIETTLFVEVIKELAIRFRTPKVEIPDLKVGPDCRK